MTKKEREKAIDLLDNLIGMIEDNQGNDYDFALKMGIEALKQEPCEDAVSRQYIIEKFNEMNGTAELDRLFEVVENAPSVTYAKLGSGMSFGKKITLLRNRDSKMSEFSTGSKNKVGWSSLENVMNKVESEE